MSNNLDVICIGAALIDMVAQVERHPLEDDEVFVSDLKLLSGGAAANTAHACAKIGLKTAFIGKLGFEDVFGNKIISDFKKVSLNTSFIKYSKKYGTGSAYVALNKKGGRRIYAHSGAANHLTKNDIKEEELIKSKVIFLSSLKNIEPFIEAATISRNNNIPVILNPGMLIIDQGFEKIKPLLEKLDIIILSKREFISLLYLQEIKLNEKLVETNAGELLNLGIKIVVITTGSKGAFLFDGKKAELIPPREIEHVIDTTGAGDAFSAGFMYGFIQNLSYKFEDLRNSVKIGNFVAGKCIQELGARNGIPNGEDLKKLKLSKKKSL
ncbi:MAG: carbohydrate kinase family protein [Promethearchaeota archaeon]